MKIFIDTADVAQIRRWAAVGILDGVTTNPSLVAKTGRRFEEVVRDICAIVDGPISAEVVSMEAAAMVDEARSLAEIHPNVVVKIPMTEELLLSKAMGIEVLFNGVDQGGRSLDEGMDFLQEGVELGINDHAQRTWFRYAPYKGAPLYPEGTRGYIPSCSHDFS
jgi:hypothetical protein